MKDLVSIVLPVYNGARYLNESIESIISQTYSNWELLILDDCSTDNTADIAIQYSNKDKRIKYYKNEKNLRLPRNLNKGFSLASGYYLTWTSDDNIYKPYALEKMINKLKEKPGAHFVFASCRTIDENGTNLDYIMVNEKSIKYLVGSNSVGACFMYTRDVYEEIGEYDPNYTLVEDFDYWQRIVTKFPTVTISQILYEYRYHTEALTSTMNKGNFNKVLESMLLKNRPLFGKLDLESNYFYYNGLYNCRINLNDKNNPYKLKYKILSTIYLFVYRIPDKIKRSLKKRK